MKKIVLAVLALLAVLGPVLAPMPAGALGAAGSAAVTDSRCPQTAVGCIYRLPDNIVAARHACYWDEREARGIPGERDAYIAWFEDNRGNSVWRDWRAAYQRCQDRHQLPGGKWAFEQMIYVGTGLL